MLVSNVLQWYALGAVTLLYLLKRLSTFLRPGYQKVLPGPWGLPWFGPLWAIDATSIYKTFHQWSTKYGALYQVTIFGQKFVVLSDPTIAKDILAKNGPVASDRPSIALIERSKDSGKYLPFLGKNDLLHKQRKFGVFINTFAHQKNYHNYMIPEIQTLLSALARKEDGYDTLLNKCCSDIACRLSFGETYMSSDISHNSHNLMRNLSPGGRITNLLTFLRWAPIWLSGEKSQEAERKEREAQLWASSFEKAKVEFKNGTLMPCHARFFFENERKLNLNELEAIYGIGMMATVSILTITAPALRFITALAMHPEWQTAVQNELDQVIGTRMITLKDSPNLPVLRAVILESMRWTSPLPTGIPHRIQEDIKYSGFTIKAGTNVMACDWAMARNPSLYIDPDSFDPNRYLDPSYSTYRGPLSEYPRIQGYHSFGFGRRVCIGQEHAASELLLLCGAMLWAFNFKPGTDETTGQPVEINVGSATPHVIPIPYRQNIEFECRDEQRRLLVQRMVESI